MRQLFTLLALAVALLAPARAEIRFSFDAGQNRWVLSNEVAEATFQFTTDGIFRMERFAHRISGDVWQNDEESFNSPIRFMIDDLSFGPESYYTFVRQWDEDAGLGGRRLNLEFEDLGSRVRIRVALEMYPNSAVLRHWLEITNLQQKTVYATWADMLPWRFNDSGRSYQWFRVNQWTVVPQELNFETLQDALDPAGQILSLQSGARGLQCSWWALRDDNNRGLFAGWEFDGRAWVTMRHNGFDSSLQFSATVQELNHPLAPGASFRVPAAFLGLFHGDWDEAGYRTQRFVESAIAKPLPDVENFPYVAWDSWGYGEDFNEEVLKRNADIAAKLGIELFIVDLGWAREIGDWRSNRDKFPSGMRGLSDYVHALGMKFGAHFALAEAAEDSPVLLQNPDWTTSQNYNYFGAKSLCLSHTPVRDWLIADAVRMIRTYNIDWILQDGENMVKHCVKSTHTHDPADSNYANAVDGLDYVVREIQRQTPGTVWENCEDGGNMMTFNMVRNYVTSITNDANGALAARQATHGATYPFPPRYVDRYMPESEFTNYTTRSFVFGGPWMLMTPLDKMPSANVDFLHGEIATFKKMRKTVRDGKVFHLTPRPNAQTTDAIQSFDSATNKGVAVVTRDGAPANDFTLKPLGLDPALNYRVTFADDPRVLVFTGAELMGAGLRVNLPAKQSAEVVYIDPQQ